MYCSGRASTRHGASSSTWHETYREYIASNRNRYPRLEEALLSGEVDAAVHSLKDLPTAAQPGLTIAAVFARDDPRDALVSGGNRTLAELARGARVGTGSVRRAAQLRALRRDIEIAGIRGNVETRIDKVRRGDYAATVLAVSGLRRSGLTHEVAEYLEPRQMLPAPGQAALALQCRDEAQYINLFSVLDDADARLTCTAERAFLSTLEGGCSAPVGALARIDSRNGETVVRLSAGVFAPDGTSTIRLEDSGSEPGELGRTLAEQAIARGAASFIESDSSTANDQRSGRSDSRWAGKRVLVPRSSQRARGIDDRLRAAGAMPICMELIESEPCGEHELGASIQRLRRFEWVVLTSPTAARRYLEGVRAAGDGWSAAREVKIAAVGPSTAETLEAAGLTVSFMPSEYRGAVLAAELPITEGPLLLPQAAGANPETAEGLVSRGAQVKQIVTYRSIPAQLSQAERAEIARGFDAILLTSGSSAESLAEALQTTGSSPADLDASCTVVCIGPTTAAKAQACGFPVTGWARRHTLDGLLERLFEPPPGERE